MSSQELAQRDGEVIDAEIVPQPGVSMTLFGTDDPDAFIESASRTATALAKVVQDRRLTVAISGRDHVKVEGWSLLGSMLGVFPVCVWTRKLEDGWEARVEARTRAGEVVGLRRPSASTRSVSGRAATTTRCARWRRPVRRRRRCGSRSGS